MGVGFFEKASVINHNIIRPAQPRSFIKDRQVAWVEGL